MTLAFATSNAPGRWTIRSITSLLIEVTRRPQEPRINRGHLGEHLDLALRYIAALRRSDRITTTLPGARHPEEDFSDTNVRSARDDRRVDHSSTAVVPPRDVVRGELVDDGGLAFLAAEVASRQAAPLTRSREGP